MNKLIFIFSIFLVPATVLGWGANGHRAVGQIAENHLSKKALRNVMDLLGDNSLAEVSNWMDEIKSDDAFDHTHDWHWVTIPAGVDYSASDLNPNGDLFAKTDEIILALKGNSLSREEEIKYLKYLIHLVGDIHQPLHVGHGYDAGGNKVDVTWFGRRSNLHKVWDTEMIESKKLSFSELVDFIDAPNKATIEKWQRSPVSDWINESASLRDQVYQLPDNNKLGYEYLYQNFDTVQLRISQAGIRLAGLLNEIYG